MSHKRGEAAELRSIYRRGDRVLVELESGFYVLVIQTSEIAGGELWLHAAGFGFEFGTSFRAKCIVRRLRRGEVLIWRK